MQTLKRVLGLLLTLALPLLPLAGSPLGAALAGVAVRWAVRRAT